MLPSGIVPLILLVPFRTPRGGKRLGGGFPGSFFGSAGDRYAATRRATRVARNTWPVSASMTARPAPVPGRGEVPVPEGGQRGEAEVLECLGGGGLAVGEKGPRPSAGWPRRSREHQSDYQVGAQGAVDALYGHRRAWLGRGARSGPRSAAASAPSTDPPRPLPPEVSAQRGSEHRSDRTGYRDDADQHRPPPGSGACATRAPRRGDQPDLHGGAHPPTPTRRAGTSR